MSKLLYKSIRCLVCPPGYYSFELNPLSCELCPKNSDCPGGAIIKPHDGFWT